MAKQKWTYELKQDLDNKTDAELVALAKQGNEFALEKIFRKYKDLVNMKVNRFFIIGADKEDIMQEGMIGLYKAIKSFSDDKDTAFKSFANLCIERQLITAIKTSNRQKHVPLNSSLSLNTITSNDDDNSSLFDIINSETAEDPLDTITKKEYYEEIGNRIDEKLSDFEKDVLTRYSMGDSYVKIAEKLETPIKSVDNAIQRIRKKAITDLTEE